MPTTRHRVSRQPLRSQIPLGATWWLANGYSPAIAEAEALGLSVADVWIASNLHYVRPVAAGQITRADLRELGYGAAIHQHVAAGRCPADDWRATRSAEVVPLRRDRRTTSRV